MADENNSIVVFQGFHYLMGGSSFFIYVISFVKGIRLLDVRKTE